MAIENTLQGVDGVKGVFHAAWDSWAEVCGITHEYSERGKVRINFGRIDRAGGTLAWSELAPLGNRSFLEQRYDRREPWHVGLDRAEQFKVDLLAVASHEIGHAIGIDHIRTSGNLMNAIYNSQIRKPQEGDKRQGFHRYGPPTVEDPVLEWAEISINVGVDTYAGKIPKLGG